MIFCDLYESVFYLCLPVPLLFAEIRADLSRGRNEYKGSVFYKKRKDFSAIQSQKNVKTVQRMSYAQSKDSVGENNVEDDENEDGIVLSLWDDKYKKLSNGLMRNCGEEIAKVLIIAR